MIPEYFPQHVMDIPPVAVEPDSASKTRCQKVAYVAKILFFALVATALFLTNAVFFLASFIIGIVFANHVQKAIDKIINLWKAAPWVATGLVIVACVLTPPPVTLVIGSVLGGAYLGSQAYQWYDNKKKLENNVPQS